MVFDSSNVVGLQRGPAFISELLSVIPNSHYHKRGTYDLKKVLLLVSYTPCFLIKLASFCNYISVLDIALQIVDYAKKKDFTSLIVVHTNRREPG